MSNKNIRTISATTVPALSSLPGNIDPALKTFLNGIVQALEIRLGRRGDSRDRAVTIRELIDSGLAKELAINPYDPNAVGITIPTGPGINLTTSVTTPSGLTAVGGFTLILLKWDLHSHLDHSHTEIWRHTSDDRNNSIHIGNAEFTRFFSDESVVADTTYYYWIRHVNEQGVISEWNAESGVSATTQPDIDFMLTLLTGEIRSTQLYSTLATDVGRIPGWHLIIGSYNNNRTLTQIDTGITDIIAVNDTQGTAITGLKNSVYVNGDSSQGLALATASALTTLTMSVTNNAGDISDNADDIAINTTATTEVAAVLWLNGDSSNPLLLATALALSTTNSNVSSLDGVVNASASDINDLEVIVNDTETGVVVTASALDILETKVGYSYLPNHAAEKLFDNAGNIDSSADVTAYNTANSYDEYHDDYVAWQDGMPMALASTQIEVADGTGAYHTLQEQAAIVSGTDGLTSQYTVKIETLGSGASARKVVGGFGLSSEPVASSGTYNINFGVLADKFFIEAPAANQSTTNSTITPFSVVTSAETFGSTTLPSGVYMDAAYIKFGSITEAHIGLGVIDTAHCGTIHADVINAGEINATFINLDNATISEDNGAIIIKDLGVDTAQINDLAVETLKIAGEAATVPYGTSSNLGVTIGYDTSEVITNWTAIDGGGLAQNYSGNVPSQVSIVVTQNFIGGPNSSNQADNVIDMAFRISSDGGSTWLTGTGTDLGRVVHSTLEDYAFTLTSGFTFAPTGTGDVLIRLYARKLFNQSSWKTKNAHAVVLGTRK